MNRFDRVNAILLLLQGRSVVTASHLSTRFGVSERTIYRDIRSLETAGVPIGAEAGVGFFLERDFALPPVRFTVDEAAALLLGEKLLGNRIDEATHRDFRMALDKVRAVVSRSDNDLLSALDRDTAVIPHSSAVVESPKKPSNVTSDDDPHLREAQWLAACRRAVVHRQVIEIRYQAVSREGGTSRAIEPIGLVYYSDHWHVIAWCRLRTDYRDFRLDRVVELDFSGVVFARHSRLTLQQFLDARSEVQHLHDIELFFRGSSAKFVGGQRYSFGLVEESPEEGGVRMRFLTHLPAYMARWLMQFADGVEVRKGDVVRDELRRLSALASTHWHTEPNDCQRS